MHGALKFQHNNITVIGKDYVYGKMNKLFIHLCLHQVRNNSGSFCFKFLQHERHCGYQKDMQIKIHKRQHYMQA